MKKWKHWKYQLVVGAPFLPWLLMQHIDMTYNTGLALGWHDTAAGLVTMFLTLGMIAVFIVGYFKLHEHDG